MKHIKIYRILGVLLILSLLLMVLPVTPAFAAITLVISPIEGQVGDSISYSGSGYSAPVESYVDLYISDQLANEFNLIDSQVTRYYRVVYGCILSDNGSYSGTFAIPTTLNQGTLGTASPHTIVAGGTYYVYVTEKYVYTVNTTSSKVIRARTTLTIAQGATLDPLSPASGPAGTPVLVTGSNFPASTALVFKFDTTTLTPTSGHTSTLSTGLFLSYIAIPSNATVGTHTINVTAGTVSLSKTFTVTASPTITLSPTEGAAGSTVTITGSSFPASTALALQFDATAITITSGDTSTSISGTFYTIITVPSSAGVGTHTITALAGTATKSATFIVTSAPTTTPTTTPPTTTPTTTPPTTTPTTLPLSIDQEEGDYVGGTISIGASGFIPNSTITVTIDGANITQKDTDASGFVVITFKVPAIQYGEHTIIATDGTNIASANFTIESTSPEVPQPLTPAMGEAISSPAFFNWDDVTDISAPVTYNLQIATSDTFDAETILIDITGIAISEYTLTEMEQLKLSAEITYYWREKAVDAALNESIWTGAGEFTMVKPFEFIGWPLYLTIGLGGLILFLLGLWVGRRTAFYY